MTDGNHIEINDTVLMSYINAELSPAQIAEVEAWLQLSENNQKHFDQLKKTWDISGEVDPEPVSVNTNAAWENILSKIQVEDTKVIPIQTKKSSNLKYLIGVAAMLAIIFTAYFSWNTKVEDINLVATHDIIKKTLG